MRRSPRSRRRGTVVETALIIGVFPLLGFALLLVSQYRGIIGTTPQASTASDDAAMLVALSPPGYPAPSDDYEPPPRPTPPCDALVLVDICGPLQRSTCMRGC